MATLSITKGWADGDVLLEADLDAIKSAVETFLNTTKINDDNIQTAGITASSKLIDATISTAKYADLSVTTAKINDLAVTAAKLAAATITGSQLASGAVSTAAKIADSIITAAKITHATTSATSNYAVLLSDECILANASGGAFVITLPTAVSNGFRVVIKKIGSDANLVTVATTSAQTIDGFASGVLTLSCPMDSVELISNGTNWSVVNRCLAPIRGLRNRTTNQTLTNDTITLLAAASTGGANVAFSASQIDILYGGYYSIQANAKWVVNAAGARTVYIYKNGSAISGATAPGTDNGGGPYVSCSILNVPLAAGDYIQAYVYQGSSGDLAIDSTAPLANSLSLVRTGPTGDV